MIRWPWGALVAGSLTAGCGRPYPLPATPGIKDVSQVADVGPHERVLLHPDVCARDDLAQPFELLDETSLVNFLHKHGFKTEVTRARDDLVYVEVEAGSKANERARLRVAILRSSFEAGEELHHALLQQGPGAWGVHRANLAVLAPRGTTTRILGFASKTELACWGVLTVAGADDAYVVAGGYREL
jgi:hypothetical protein